MLLLLALPSFFQALRFNFKGFTPYRFQRAFPGLMQGLAILHRIMPDFGHAGCGNQYPYGLAMILPGSSAIATTNSHLQFSLTGDHTLNLREAGSETVIETAENAF
ncbi:MAG: hypothetical protein OXF29_07125 [Hyphomicrobiales bacterium]|nr:hypothetical protein [Hyphomicrobiales bacterium]